MSISEEVYELIQEKFPEVKLVILKDNETYDFLGFPGVFNITIEKLNPGFIGLEFSVQTPISNACLLAAELFRFCMNKNLKLEIYYDYYVKNEKVYKGQEAREIYIFDVIEQMKKALSNTTDDLIKTVPYKKDKTLH